VQLARRLGRPLGLTDAALAWLREQPWPGNVRALEHAIERAAVLSEKEMLDRDDFIPALAPGSRLTPDASPGLRGAGTLREAVEDAERGAIRAALEAAGGNRRDAAKRLGVSLRTLFYKMDRYGLE
jgi:DNA-binding NtrC family response regulator